jgi:hypothetical protein
MVDTNERQVWHVRRAFNTSVTYYLGAMVGVTVGIPIIYFTLYLVANYFDNVFKIFLGVFIFFSLTNVVIYRAYRKNPGKIFRHPTIGHAIHDGLPTAKLYIYGTYFCILLVLISADDSPARGLFCAASDFSRYQWFLFVLDNAIKAVIFDFAEIFNIQYSDIKPVNNSGKTVIFLFRTLMTISFFDFIFSISRSWNTDRLMYANISSLRRDMKIKEVAQNTLIVAPVQVGEYQPLYQSKEK